MRKTFYSNNYRNSINFEVYRAKDEFALNLILENDNEKTITFSICLPFLFKFYVSLDLLFLVKTKWWRKLLLLDDEHKYDGRRFSISIFPDNDHILGKDYIFSFDLGTYLHESGGFHLYKSLAETIYGKSKYKNETLEVVNTKVFIPGVYGYEDNYYDLKVTKSLSTWTYERFNKIVEAIRFEVECEDGVPHRVKWGEQDSCYSITYHEDNNSIIGMIRTCAENWAELAINKFINEIQSCRKNG